MSIWRYYLKMVRYEQFFIPATMAVICLVLILLMQTSPNPSASTSVATAFVEAALPLAAAMIATAVFLNDPVLELLYTLPRPLWRTLLEKMVLLIAVMTVFYLLFVAAMRLVGVPLTGWGSSFAVWLIPALAWLGLTFFGGAVFRSSTAGSGLTALLWIAAFLTHTEMLQTPVGRAFYPFMTIFDPNSPDWLTNRAVLALIGVVGIGLALLLMRSGEHYFKSEA